MVIDQVETSQSATCRVNGKWQARGLDYKLTKLSLLSDLTDCTDIKLYPIFWSFIKSRETPNWTTCTNQDIIRVIEGMDINDCEQ